MKRVSRLLDIISFILLGFIILYGCNSSNSSNNRVYYPYYKVVNTQQDDSKRIEEMLKQFESYRNNQRLNTQPIQRHRNQRDPDWDRGYSHGWDVGYEDAMNGNGAWASYDDSGKGGEFLDGYECGYVDGYENGKDERKRDGEDVEDL